MALVKFKLQLLPAWIILAIIWLASIADLFSGIIEGIEKSISFFDFTIFGIRILLLLFLTIMIANTEARLVKK